MSNFETDPIEVSKATAVCEDCGVKIRGNFRICLVDWAYVSAVASGDLVNDCAKHHDQNRTWGRGAMQHDCFTVIGIGSFRVSSMSVEVGIDVNSSKIRERLNQQVAEIRKKSGYGF